MSRIEQLISDIEAYIDNCKYQPFSNNKIIVDKDQLEDMLSELRKSGVSQKTCKTYHPSCLRGKDMRCI